MANNFLPATQEPQETQVQPLDQENPLEEEMTTHSSILSWRILWTKEIVHGVAESHLNELT